MAKTPVAPSKAKPTAKSAAKSTATKTKPTALSVSAFLGAVADPDQKRDAQVLVKLMTAATGEKPAMWGPSIVGFGTYRYRYDSGREGEMCRIGFSPRKGSTVIYMINGFAEEAELIGRLGKVKTGKSCLYIKRLADIDMPTLEMLIARSIAYVNEKYPISG
ncbi:MAG: DUF1801 domain-containing protein [Alphaproteobacteria bacterium]|nr:DUF1801 domain-containing protein [Alphaproteobacteria bacterium]